MTIWERVKTALAGLNTPMAANTFLTDSGEELPDVFFVYSLISDPAEQHADNVETLRFYRVQVTLYSRSGLAEVTPDQAAVTAAMLADGFLRGPARELPYNVDTRHFGLAMDFHYLEEE